MSNPNQSVPDRAGARAPATSSPGIAQLPARAEPGATRKRQQYIFEQVKGQVLDTATRYFENSVRILKTWLADSK